MVQTQTVRASGEDHPTDHRNVMTTTAANTSASTAARPARARVLTVLPTTALVLDSLLILGATLVAVLGRSQFGLFDHGADVSRTVPVAGPLIVVGWLLIIAASGGYRPNAFGAGTDEYKRVANASLITAAMVGIGCYLAKFPLSRGFFVLLFAFGVPMLVLGRFALRQALHSARRSGVLRRRVIIAGSASHIDAIAAVLSREQWLGYHIAGALTPPHELEAETATGIPIIGNVEDIVSAVDEVSADGVFIVSGAFARPTQMRQVAWDLEQHDVEVVLAPSITDVSSERISIRPVAGMPLVYLDRPRYQYALTWAKRLFDVLGSLALLIAFSPLFAFTTLSIKLHDHGPVFFRQTRVGRDGREFTCLKFRSMVIDAEAILARLHEEQGYELGTGLFKMKDDPRITKPGRWIRRYSVDELPQLINVLRGDMSLVGPRPPLPSEVATYDDTTLRRLRVRPGMTGLWQVSGRSDLPWEEAIRLDLYYVDNWSMFQDLSILVRTVRAVFGSRGAY